MLFSLLHRVSIRRIPSRMSSASVLNDMLPLVVNNANIVMERIKETTMSINKDPSNVQLVAVSKTKPASDIQTLYDAGYRHFGENYFQELVEKAAVLPADIQWHFIGHLQSSKSNKLLKDVPNLCVVETVDTIKLATKLNSAAQLAVRTSPLAIFIQVDTSGEETKSGVGDAKELFELSVFVRNECPNLRLAGLMTIGAPGDMTCFDKLVQYRKELSAKLEVDESSLQLSMGMSGDFQEAIVRGSTSVRVGSTIFGERLYPKKV